MPQLKAQAHAGPHANGLSPRTAARWVDERFRSAYVLLTRPSDVRPGARIEAFGTRNRGSDVDDEYDENGWAAMLAAKRDWRHFTGLVELLHVSSRREQREDARPGAAAGPNAAPGRSANALVTTLADRGVYRSRLNLAQWCVDLLFSRLACACAAPLAAAPLNVRVVDALRASRARCGRHLLSGRPRLAPPRAGGRYVVSQQNLQFHPFLTIVPVGADVSFPNFDPTKHHVYSFSPAKRFELKLFAKDQSRTVHFDKPGVVALGCNIHDQMSAFIFVTDSAWTARTNAQGMAAFADAPDAAGRVTVWHPYLRAPGGRSSRRRPAQRSASFQVRLRPPPAMTMTDY